MTTEVYVFAILGGIGVLVLFGWVLFLAGAEAYDIARVWRLKRERRAVVRAVERIMDRPLSAWSPRLGATCWLLNDPTDPASGGRVCTVVLRDDVSGAVLEVAASDPRICRVEAAP